MTTANATIIWTERQGQLGGLAGSRPEIPDLTAIIRPHYLGGGYEASITPTGKSISTLDHVRDRRGNVKVWKTIKGAQAGPRRNWTTFSATGRCTAIGSRTPRRDEHQWQSRKTDSGYMTAR